MSRIAAQERLSRAAPIWLPALAASGLLAVLDPLPRGDALATTLPILPLVVAALVAIGRRVGDRTPRETAIAEGAALGIILLLALSRGSLGIAFPAALPAAGLALLLGHRVVRLVPALRRTLGRGGRGLDPPAVFFLLPLVVYLALIPWSHERRPPNGDEPYYLIQAHSLAYDLDVELSNNYAAGDSLRFMTRRIEPQYRDPTGLNGAVYSRHTMALPLVIAPVYRLTGVYGALAMMAAMTAALAWATLRLALSYTPRRRRGATLAWAIFAFTAPLLLYSHQVWVEVPAALLLVLGLTAVRRLEAGAERRRSWAAVLVCALLLPLLKLRFALLAGPLLVLAWWRSGRSRKVLLAVAGLSLGGLLALLAYNQVVFGNPLKMHNWQAITGLYQRPLSSYLRGACGLLLDPAFGLAGCAPVWLLLLPAGALHLGRRSRLLGDFLALNATYLVVLMPRQAWYGEWSPPFRYGLVMLPLLALFLVPLLDRRTPTVGRALTGLLVTLTLTLGLLWVVEPNWTYNFGDGRTLLFDAISHRTGSDLARFFPSYVHSRAASWIWPLVCLLALPLYWLGRRRAGRAATCGAALALLAAAAVVVAAETLPTRVVEIEDPWVEKRGGELYPERWARSRVSYDPGWILAPGDAASATVNPGGESVRLVLEVGRRAPAGPLRIRVQADGVEIAAWSLAQPHRQTLTAGPVAWPRGARRLSLTVERSDPTDSGSVVNLDRLRLRWGGPVGPGTAGTEHGSHRHLEPSFRVGLVDLAQDSRHVEA